MVGKVVGRTRSRPGVVGGRAVLVGARDPFGGHLDRLLEVAPRDADQRGIVGIGRQAFGIGHERVDQPAERGIDRALMRHAGDTVALWRPRADGAALRHVGGLVPAQHRPDRAEIADLEQPALELLEPVFGGAPVASAFNGRRRLGLQRARNGALPCGLSHCGFSWLALIGTGRVLGRAWLGWFFHVQGFLFGPAGTCCRNSRK